MWFQKTYDRHSVNVAAKKDRPINSMSSAPACSRTAAAMATSGRSFPWVLPLGASKKFITSRRNRMLMTPKADMVIAMPALIAATRITPVPTMPLASANNITKIAPVHGTAPATKASKP